VEPILEQEYIATGKVRLVYKHFPIVGPESWWAAQASECAAEQGAFWAYHGRLFASQAGENRGAFRRQRLEEFARELGLDMTAFRGCLDSGKYAAKVQEDAVEAQRRGVTGTPTFFINGQRIGGLAPYSTMKEVIESKLQEAGQ